MPLANAAKSFVDKSADNIIWIDDLVADKREEFRALYLEILQDPERRNDEIELKYITYFYEQSINELGGDYTREYWQAIAEAEDQSFDELNSIPMNERGDVFHTTRKIMSAASWEQAFIESGIAEEVIRNGLEMAEVSKAFGEVIGEFAQGNQWEAVVNEIIKAPKIKEVRAKKLEDRKVGTPESPIANPEPEEPKEEGTA